MGRPIEVTFLDYTAADLREWARQESDGTLVRRLLAIAAVLEGDSRTDAARHNGMDRQTLCDWVHRYNAEGIEGLHSRDIPGRPAKLSGEQMDELQQMILDGPDPGRHEVARWRCVDLRDEIEARWSVNLHKRSVAKLLNRLKMTRLQPRPHHPKADEAAQVKFKKNFARLVKKALPKAARGKVVEIWFQML